MTTTRIQQNIGGFNIDDIVNAKLEELRLEEIRLEKEKRMREVRKKKNR